MVMLKLSKMSYLLCVNLEYVQNALKDPYSMCLSGHIQLGCDVAPSSVSVPDGQNTNHGWDKTDRVVYM